MANPKTRRQQAAVRHEQAANRHAIGQAKSIVHPPKADTAAPKPLQPKRSTSLPHPKQKVDINIKAMAKVIGHREHHESATEIAGRKRREAARRAVREAERRKFDKEKQLVRAEKRAAARAAKRREEVLHRIKHQILGRHAGPRKARSRMALSTRQAATPALKSVNWNKVTGWR